MATPIKRINSPRPFQIDVGLTMGEDVADGLCYEWDVNGVLTKTGATSTIGVVPTRRAKTGDQVSGVLMGACPVKIGVGGCAFKDPLKYGTTGRMVVGTVGTDLIVAYALRAAIEDAVIDVLKIA